MHLTHVVISSRVQVVVEVVARVAVNGSDYVAGVEDLNGGPFELDRAQTAVPPSWPEGRTPQLLEYGDANSWHEALDLGFKQLVIYQIRYHLRRCLRTL